MVACMKKSLNKSIYTLTFILITVMLAVVIITTQQLYQAALQQAKERLRETIHTQARLMESIALFAQQGESLPLSPQVEQAVLTQFREAYLTQQNIDHIAPFTVAKQNGESIQLIFDQQLSVTTQRDSIVKQQPNSQSLIAMQLALKGESGTLMTENWKGESILVAYEPVAHLNYGMIDTINLSELRKPFIHTSFVSITTGLILILAGIIYFHLITNRLIDRLHRSEYRIRLLLNSTAEGVFGINLKGNATFANTSCLTLLGYSDVAQLIDQPLTTILTLPEAVKPHELTPTLILETFQQQQKAQYLELPLYRQNGSTFMAKLKLSPIIENQRCIGAVILLTDITGKLAARELKRLATTVYDNIEEGIIVTDIKTHIISINHAFSEITGYAEDEVLGKTPKFLQSGIQDEAFYTSMWQQVIHDGSWNGVIWDRNKDGQIIPLWSSISSVKDQDDSITHFVGAFSDISSLKAKEDMLEHMAHHDSLTDLPNRLLLDARFKLSLQNSARRHKKLAVLFIDLDSFKIINDTYGHKSGDQVLQQTASRLNNLLRQEDTVSRLGGDEFVVLLPEISSTKTALELAKKIQHSISQNIMIDAHQTLNIHCSIGVALYPDHGQDTATLLECADKAMYKAKDKGKNFISLYQ